MSDFEALADRLEAIATHHPGDIPADNVWCNGLDAWALHGFLAERRPATYLEIGSGVSTTVARKAIERHGLPTRIVSIDPAPRSDIDALCDVKFRARLEDTDLSVFDTLSARDVVYLDGSHQVLPNSDTTVFMLEVLPRLPPGVLVGIHDIYLPDDYPDDAAATGMAEQYLVAAYLLGGSLDKVVLPSAALGRRGFQHGVALWLET
jgi:hypothetical protein